MSPFHSFRPDTSANLPHPDDSKNEDKRKARKARTHETEEARKLTTCAIPHVRRTRGKRGENSCSQSASGEADKPHSSLSLFEVGRSDGPGRSFPLEDDLEVKRQGTSIHRRAATKHRSGMLFSPDECLLMFSPYGTYAKEPCHRPATVTVLPLRL